MKRSVKNTDSFTRLIITDTLRSALLQEWRELYEPHHGEKPSNVRVSRDHRYGPADRNTLDVYVPLGNPQPKKPVLLFMHGGGFFSGDKQWSDKVCFHPHRFR